MSDNELGPIDYLTVEFGAGQISEEDASILLDAVDSGVVRVLDLEFVVKEADGSVQRVDVDEIKNPAGVDLSVWKDAYSGLLDESDLAQTGAALSPGSLAGIASYERHRPS